MKKHLNGKSISDDSKISKQSITIKKTLFLNIENGKQC